MRLIKILFMSAIILFSLTGPASAQDFGWTEKLNRKARINPTGFRTSLATRFDLGTNRTRAIISRCRYPADAYIVLRLGEISGKPEDFVIDKYSSYADRNWDNLAEALGIESESEEYLALKQDHDLFGRKRTESVSSGPDRALLLMLTGSVCKVEAQNKTAW